MVNAEEMMIWAQRAAEDQQMDTLDEIEEAREEMHILASVQRDIDRRWNDAHWGRYKPACDRAYAGQQWIDHLAKVEDPNDSLAIHNLMARYRETEWR